jgi:hypothetical protein
MRHLTSIASRRRSAQETAGKRCVARRGSVCEQPTSSSSIGGIRDVSKRQRVIGHAAEHIGGLTGTRLGGG